MDIEKLTITPEEFLQYTGIDLNVELKGTIVDDGQMGGNPSNEVNAFILRVRRRMNNWIDSHFRGHIGQGYPCESDYQREHYKMALIEQVLYVLKNGDISVDSGRDDNGAMTMSRQDIDELSIGLEAKRNLILAGLCDRSVCGNLFSDWWWRI